MIKRDKYLKQLAENRNNGFPKIITGIRRCGKSYLIKEIFRHYLLENGVSDDCIMIIELDDDRNYRYRDPIYLGEYVREYCSGKENCVVFIDEIQLVLPIVNPIFTDGKHVFAKENDETVISFVDVILGLSREKNIDLYVTGSNSKMLSSDIITQFRDKAVNIHLAPLSFDEFYEYSGYTEEKALSEYMMYGGMPLAVLKSRDDKKEYLKNLFETTYFRDIIEHNRLRKSSTLDEICDLLAESIGNFLNSTKIANTIKSAKNENIDRLTIERYIDFFADSFIINKVHRFDLKGKSEIGALQKYYFTDLGLRNARCNFAYGDHGQLLENLIYNELLYNGYSVNIGSFDSVGKDIYGKSVRKTYEVDFYAKKDNRQFYIQVCDDISDLETRYREVRPYFLLNDQVQKIIVIKKEICELRDNDGFTVIGVTEFLLRFIK